MKALVGNSEYYARYVNFLRTKIDLFEKRGRSELYQGTYTVDESGNIYADECLFYTGKRPIIGKILS